MTPDPTLPNTFPAVADTFDGPCMYEVRPEWRSGRGRWWRASGLGYTDDIAQAGVYNGSLGVVGSEWSYAVSADLVRSYLRPTPAVDPTLPGIPQDATDHAANVERARVLLDNPAPSSLADVYVERVAEALTVAELRGWAKGVESAKGALVAAPALPPIGIRWGDLTAKQRAALPVGTKIRWCGIKTLIGPNAWRSDGGTIWTTDELSDGNEIVSYPEAPK